VRNYRETSNVSEVGRKHSGKQILFPGKQILFPQQCFHGWANRETFEETSRITNVSATMFPSLPKALINTGLSITFTNYESMIGKKNIASLYTSSDSLINMESVKKAN
jgi:hypothetical protein